MSLEQQVREILRDRATKALFNQARLAVLAEARQLSGDDGDFARIDAGELYPLESNDVSTAAVNSLAFERAVNHILETLPKPHTIFGSEIQEMLSECLIVPDEHFEAAYAIFSAYVTKAIKDKKSDPFPIAIADFLPEDLLDDGPGAPHQPFDDELCDVGVFKVCGAYMEISPVSGKFWACVQGEGTVAAINNLGSVVAELFPSIVRSLCLIQTESSLQSTILTAEDLAYIEDADELNPFNRLPRAYLRRLPKHPQFYATCLRLSLNVPIKKDSLNRRLYHAIRLLAQSDTQADPAISLSLSFAAMEALVCRKGEDGINAMLSANMAVLLEPEGRYRKSAAAFVKKLYQVRSDALHGTDLDVAHAEGRKARSLAAALLHAVFERQAFIARMGSDPESPAAFFSELEAMKYRAEPSLPNIDPPVVVRFWRDTPTA